ncbi:NmrA-like family protein [Colletotrichum godetiae]|uniref:NmrA-like family protein n=1 Tax=Colletotrichum godetiae TaxID=1209918 RepID=A0AAJ0A7Y7_9PEZI|nr:NmrA-like family protein [Colletotrichum godetiae]KAK1658194.1 NmrA-like family protein [Colletotrichum godetiae]
MTPTILIAGATGNTGRSVVETLSQFVSNSDAPPNIRILALTRSIDSSTAQRLASLPNITFAEKNWVDIDALWLHEQKVFKAFIASHSSPNQFAEESAFHLAALKAGVQYVVRISTTAPNVRPDSDAYYPRAHWAIETMLGSPEFKELKWTSLQPNIFFSLHLYGAVEFVKEYRQTKKQGTLRLIADKDAPVGTIDADDVGTFAAHLLWDQDPSRHNGKKYILNGPTDVTGRQIVQWVEEAIGAPVESVQFRDVSLVDDMASATKESKNVILSIKAAPVSLWEGKCPASTTSKEVIEILAPSRSVVDGWKALLSAI